MIRILVAKIRLFPLFPGGAVGSQGTAFAFGGPGGAYIPAKKHHPVAERPGFCRRDALAELLLHLHRVLGPVGDAQPPGDADAVGVAHIGGLAVHVP